MRGKLKDDEEIREGWQDDVNEIGEPIVKTPWDYWKESTDFKNKVSGHSEIRNDVLLATRNFQHRVEMFRKEVMFGNNNPMKVRHITYRVEFQGRGAGHNHGVLWVDLEEINKDMKEELKEEMEKVKKSILEEEGYEEKVNSETVLVDAYEKLRNNEKLKKSEGRALELFADEFCTCSPKSQRGW